MRTAKHSITIKLITILLATVMLCPVHTLAAENASEYLSMYSAFVYPENWGQIQVWFQVDGTGYMDEIGALEIRLYESTDNENWTWVKTFDHTDYPNMLGYNNFYHDNHVSYVGTIGHYYKAYVCVWAGKDGDGDTRYFWTNSERSSIFAG